jgi:hypothetical protein
MNFGEALKALKEGARVARAGWNGRNMWLAYIPSGAWQVPNKFADGHPTLPFILMRTADGWLVPWLALQTDLLAEDWALVPVYPMAALVQERHGP